MRLVIWAALLTVGCSPIRYPRYPSVPPGVAGRPLARSAALADLDQMFQTLDAVHPDLYAVRSRESVDEERRTIAAALPASLTRAEFWIRIAPLVASLGDGHTGLSYPVEEVIDRMVGGELLFPADVAADVGVDGPARLTVTNVYGGAGLARGERILQLNGRETDALLREWMLAFSGESDTYRAVSVADSFRNLLVIHSIAAPYTLRVAGLDGIERNVTLAGVKREALARPRSAPPQPNFSYRTLEAGVGYMNFYSMGGDPARFQGQVASMFRQLAADGARTLIVDLRANGGGNSRMGDALLRHFAAKPYRDSARKEWKMSAQYRAFVKTMLRPPLALLRLQYLHPQGRALFGGPAGKIVTFQEPMITPKRAEPFFGGPVCVLIGTRTFSSAVDLSDAIETYGLATTLGEETGGHPNTFGEVYPFRLARSGLEVTVSSARFVRASGDVTDRRGVIPDIVIRPTAADLASGRDAVLERARSCSALQPSQTAR